MSVPWAKTVREPGQLITAELREHQDDVVRRWMSKAMHRGHAVRFSRDELSLAIDSDDASAAITALEQTVEDLEREWQFTDRDAQ